ncbi:multiple monosaccharide ABC transporter ATP-binding protein [Spirochaeta isovalerica]|uniref:Putative multiple sugar transport system ATP-binding protein n=1 Tax=Spirochaeta isovalerica TaxID=150 RepID=A0A841RA03_9SPIO|nr:multiple monosaccharide ABC transporter ATP-binding protein [Spirochaeta isovalerica]MBB6479759.1 putative multiple sugar transport system ATP-binding protein [Spirochaeta isovalerica]
MANTILEMRDITKKFAGVPALQDVSFSVQDDEIHAIVGENGAGKSTLMKVLSGVHPHGSFDGKIFVKGEECSFKTIKDSEKLGIVIIHQELALIPYLSIAENIFLGNEKASGGVIDWNKTVDEAGKLLKKVGLDENPNTLIGNIGVGKQQLVEIAKALSKEVRILILDEPTAALNDEESGKLLDLLKELKAEGITSILISHKLNEIEQVADKITVIRDGRVIENMTREEGDFHEDRIIKSMVGREITDRWPSRNNEVGEVIFRVEDWSVYHPQHEHRKIVNNVNFNIRRGEVIGFAGLMGAGRTEIAMSIFGKSYGQKHTGRVYKNGREIRVDSVNDCIDNGLVYLTEDRKAYGLVLINDIKNNISLANLGKVSKFQVINPNEEVVEAEKYRNKLAVRSTGLEQVVESLSGGNQQKVVLSKWLMSEPDILLLDEPTRGIDVGAKYEIYTIINELAAEGKAVLIISSEMPELLGMCDRIYVVNDGEMAGCLDRGEASQESIMKTIMTHQKEKKSVKRSNG